MTTEPTNPTTKRRRWWAQFSLRTFFILMTIACLWLGWQVQKAREQREAVAAIREMGGRVWHVDEDGRLIANADPFGPMWLQEWFGRDFFNDVVIVFLHSTPISDVTLLSGLPRIQVLSLANTQVSDMSPLAELTSLEILDLTSTLVGEKQVEELRKALPNCRIYWSPAFPDAPHD